MKNLKILPVIILISIISVASAQDNEPLALRKIMQDMGDNMQAITDGISLEDWDQVNKNALLIADHPQPPFGEKFKILRYIGTDARKFKKYDGITHDAASELGLLAKQNKGSEVIQAFAKLQKSCFECHQTFRKSFLQNFYIK